MKTIKIFLSIFFTVILIMSARAQVESTGKYENAIGIRAGGTSGITVKHFVSDGMAIEGILGFWNRGIGVTGLIEMYVPAFDAEGLYWYYGGGGHVNITTGKRYYGYECGPLGCRTYDTGEVGIGIDGIAGMEYKIPPIPVAISLDLKPLVEVTSRGNFGVGIDPGLGIKLAL